MTDQEEERHLVTMRTVAVSVVIAVAATHWLERLIMGVVDLLTTGPAETVWRMLEAGLDWAVSWIP